MIRLFVFGVFLSPCLIASSLQFEKTQQSIGLMLKTYQISSVESIALYGATRTHFIGRYGYWGEFGYGAILGERGGYLEGGVVSGLTWPISNRIDLDLSVMVGAGGGASAPQGGGMVLNPRLGLGYQYSQATRILIDMGYIRFLNGDIESPTVGLSIHRRVWHLTVKRKEGVQR